MTKLFKDTNMFVTNAFLFLTSVMPKGMLPTYSRRACLVIWLPTTGTGVGVTAKPSGVMVGRRAVAGIWPAAGMESQI